MSSNKNCWEVKKCERQPGGAKTEELGVCPSAESGSFDGINNGTHGGRFCWRIAGTLCGGEPQGTAAKKTFNCLNCDFFKLVIKEEGPEFILSQADFIGKIPKD